MAHADPFGGLGSSFSCCLHWALKTWMARHCYYVLSHDSQEVIQVQPLFYELWFEQPPFHSQMPLCPFHLRAGYSTFPWAYKSFWCHPSLMQNQGSNVFNSHAVTRGLNLMGIAVGLLFKQKQNSALLLFLPPMRQRNSLVWYTGV